MEQEKMKRARERDDETEIRSLENNIINNNKSKKRDLQGTNIVMKEKHHENSDPENVSPSPWDSSTSHLSLGVFDFPWLKDGVMSKTEGFFLNFEDEHEVPGIDDFSEAYRYCETPEASKMVETVWHPFERSEGLEIKAEDVDCIWSSLLNKPLSQQEQHGGSL